MDSVVTEMSRLIERAVSASLCMLIGFSFVLLKLGTWLLGVPFASWIVVGGLLLAVGVNLHVSMNFVSGYSRLAFLRRKQLIDTAPVVDGEMPVEQSVLIALVENQSVRAVNFLYLQLYTSCVTYSVAATVSLSSFLRGFGVELIFVGAVFFLGVLGMILNFLGDLNSLRLLRLILPDQVS